MFKRIVFVIVLIILAKPAYDFAYPFVEPYLRVSEVETLPATENLPKVDPVIGENVAVNTAYPSKINSVESLADAMYYHFANFEENFTLKYTGNTADLTAIIQQASELAAKRDPFIEGHMQAREINYTYTKFVANITVSQSYLISSAEAATVSATVDQIIIKYNAQSLSDFEKIKFVNDYIVKNTIYSTETTGSPHSAYTLLTEGKAVCQGYALLAQQMFTKLGIESLYVVGEAGGIGHAWNLVKLNNEWYHVDTTWNDPVPDRGAGSVHYAYLLMSDDQISKDHTWIHEDYPQAVNAQYSYLHVVSDAYQQNDSIYFSNEQDNNTLYRLNLLNSQIEKIGNIRVQYVAGGGDWLYFSNYSNGGYLTKMRHDGSEQTTLLKEHVEKLYVLDGYLFFETNGEQKKIAI